MGRFLFAAALLVISAASALAQSSPGLVYGQVPTAGQWNSFFAAKQDVLGYTPLNSEGGTMTGRLVTYGSQVSGSGFRLSPGVAPSSPVDGDMWTTTSGLFVRVGGVTQGPIISFTFPIDVTLGGTGATTPEGARTNLLGLSTTTDTAVARYNGTTGAFQNSVVTLSNAGVFAGGSWNGTVGATTPATGAFTTLNASGAIAGAGLTSSANVSPSANDGAALGTTSASWSDLFLASGGVVNWANGNVTLTHSSGLLTIAGGDLQVSSAGTNTASVATLAATQTMTNKTLTSATLTTPTLTLKQSASPTPTASGDVQWNTTNTSITVGNGSSQTTFLPATSLATGQARLILDSTVLRLLPYNGSQIVINGFPQSVPAAGITLTTSGLSATTTYYIYAFMSGGTMTLEASTTGHTTNSNGIEIKTGDATRSLVGMARPTTGPAWVDSASQRFVRSWFNRGVKAGSATYSADRSTTSTSLVELNTEIRNEFLIWADEAVQANFSGWGLQTSNVGVVKIMLDGAAGTVIAQTAVATPSPGTTASIAGVINATEGYHYLTLCGLVTGGSLTIFGTGSANGLMTSRVF